MCRGDGHFCLPYVRLSSMCFLDSRLNLISMRSCKHVHVPQNSGHMENPPHRSDIMNADHKGQSECHTGS